MRRLSLLTSPIELIELKSQINCIVEQKNKKPLGIDEQQSYFTNFTVQNLSGI